MIADIVWTNDAEDYHMGVVNGIVVVLIGVDQLNPGKWFRKNMIRCDGTILPIIPVGRHTSVDDAKDTAKQYHQAMMQKLVS